MIVYVSDINDIICNESLVKNYEAKLSCSDKKRYQSISDLNRKLQFLVGRSLIKEATNEYPELSKTGKPFVSNGYISLSHSDNYVILGVCDTPIGIDIENFLKKKDFLKISQRLGFSIKSSDALTFYRQFTRYEADYKLGVVDKDLSHSYYLIDTFIICISLLNNKENIKFIKSIPSFKNDVFSPNILEEKS